jgi:hypothetical protein
MIVIPSDLSSFSVGDLSEMIQDEVQKTTDALSNIQKVQIKEDSTQEQAANKAQWQKFLLLADPAMMQKAEDAMESVLIAYQVGGARDAFNEAEFLAPELAPLMAFLSLTHINPADPTASNSFDPTLDPQNNPAKITPSEMIAMQIASSLFVAVSTLGIGKVREISYEGGLLGDELLLNLGAAGAAKMDAAAMKQVESNAQIHGGVVAFSYGDNLASTLDWGWSQINNFDHASQSVQKIVEGAIDGNTDLSTYQDDPNFANYLQEMSSNQMLQSLLQSASDNTDGVQNLLQTELSTKQHLSTIGNNA